MRKHRDRVISKESAKKIAREIKAATKSSTQQKQYVGSIGMKELRQHYGDSWSFPEVKENT